MPDLKELGREARAAANLLAYATTAAKNKALTVLAELLENRREEILSANEIDLEAGRKAGLTEAMLERLDLRKYLAGIANDIRHVSSLPDPVGEVFDSTILPNGLRLEKRRTPIGVIGVIYESRPNVTLEVAALTLKTGNAVILRGGSETLRTNIALLHIIKEALQAANLPINSVQLIEHTDRALVTKLLHLYEWVDLIIPRGGAGLHRLCREQSKIPVITGGVGICHLYIDETADLERSLEVIRNAKVQRPAACNALDTILVHRSVASAFIPKAAVTLAAEGVLLKVDSASWDILQNSQLSANVRADKAREQDWETEWISLVLGIKVVDDIDEAIAHIRLYSQGHSDGILTADSDNACKFINEVDSAAVYVNASTRFTDGGQFGLGAEVAISTQKVHARGPMGLRELTSYKWVAQGDYHVRK